MGSPETLRDKHMRRKRLTVGMHLTNVSSTYLGYLRLLRKRTIVEETKKLMLRQYRLLRTENIATPRRKPLFYSLL